MKNAHLIRRTLARCATLIFAIAGLSAPLRARQTVPLDQAWQFHLGDVPGAEAAAFQAKDWQRVELPHDWSIALPIDEKAPSLGGGGFFQNGIGWYRQAFAAPKSWGGQRISLELDGVYMNATIWLNGVELARHPYGYTPFSCDLTAHVRVGATNVVAVRVDNAQQPNSRWYTGAGIYRHVRLVVTDPVHFVDDGTFVQTKTLSESSASLQISWELRNETEQPKHLVLQAIVLDPLGHDAAGTEVAVDVAPHATAPATATVEVPHPQSWSLPTPIRYRVSTRVLVDGQPVDQIVTPFGIRTIRVSAERGFELNGHPMKLVGGNVHHDNGPLGAAAFDRAEERRVELLKSAGFNAIRTSHNPPSPAFLEACDRLGMLVLDEAFDCWEKGKTKYDYSVVFKEWWQRDIDAMVRRDRNHPSVVLWSIGNEMLERGSANGLRIAHELTACIRELDATRPITAGVNGPGKNGDWTKFDPLFATMDVAGYNYELGRHSADHARVPARVIVVTESYQNETFTNWSIAQDNTYVIGDFVWSGMDYLGEAGIGRVFPPGEKIVRHWEGNQFPWHGAACGDIDITGWRKPISHYRNIVWDRGEKLYVAVLTPSGNGQPWGISPWAMPPALPSWTWPGHEGKDIAVEVYSRHDKARLYLGDRLIGEKPTGRAEQFKATFTFPYEPGTLRAVGVDGEVESETAVLKTAGPAAGVRLNADRPMIRADGQDLCFVTAEVVDAAGVLVPTSDASVKFTVAGPATIAGIGNGDLTSFETYIANPHRVAQGRALFVLRATHQSGPIGLTATADGLKDGKVSVLSATP